MYMSGMVVGAHYKDGFWQSGITVKSDADLSFKDEARPQIVENVKKLVSLQMG